MRDLLLQFESQSVLQEPAAPGGVLTVLTTSGFASMPNLGIVVAIRPVYPRSSEAQTISGPWVVRVINGASPGALKTAAASYPVIAYSEVIWASDDPSVGLVPTIGELPMADFPEDELFCENQTQLHSRHDGEVAMEGDPCVIDVTTYQVDMDAPQAWAISKGQGVTVAIIDTGVHWPHPDLGGPIGGPYGTTVDSMLALVNGNILQNPQEIVGDVGSIPGVPDGCPGICGVDDDGDGEVDEDIYGLGVDNTAEADIQIGAVTAAGDLWVEDATANWAENELVGLYLTGWFMADPLALSVGPYGVNFLNATIVSNTATRIYTASEGLIAWVRSFGVDGWATWIAAGTVDYKISNLADSDGDGVVDDLGHTPGTVEADDDDENGWPEDFVGMDFQDGKPTVVNESFLVMKEDYEGIDNDPRGLGPHGTWVAGILGAREDATGLVGVAPGVKLIPIRAGYVTRNVETEELYEGVGFLQMLRGIDYAISRGVDIIVIAWGWTDACEIVLRTDIAGNLVHPLGRAFQRAIDAGILITNGSNNTGGMSAEPMGTACFDEILAVAGTKRNGRPWEQSTHGPWVDISAQAVHIAVPNDCVLKPCGLGAASPGGPGWHMVEDGGTSFSSPQVGGVLALMKSAHPTATAQELRAKLLASTDAIDYQADLTYEGNMGSGRVNAYKALTWYGDITAFNIPLVWSDEVWVSGDIFVPLGSTLTIEPATVIHVAQDDIQNWGLDPEHPERSGAIDPEMIEFIVDGALVAQGTELEPIVFEIFADEGPSGPPHNPNRQWGHFKLAASENFVGGHVEFRDLLPRDGVNQKPANGFTFNPGSPITFSWTQDYVESSDTPPLVFEASVRIRGSADGGLTFDAGTTYAITTATGSWTAGENYADAPLVLRVEFLDDYDRVIAWEDFDDYRVIAPFENVSATSGITIPEGKQPYASTPVDYNADGREDLVISYTDRRAQLYRNLGPSGDAAEFNDFATTQLGDGFVTNTKGVNRLDYFNDGGVDLFFAGTGGSRLFHGSTTTPGDLTLEVSSLYLGAAATTPSSAAAFGDYNKDGILDVYIVQDGSDVLLKGTANVSAPHVLPMEYTFSGYVGVTAAVGLHTETTTTNSAMWADADGDGDQDLLVTWDGQLNPYQGSDPDWCFYYLNTQPQQGQYTFVDVTGAASGPGMTPLGSVHGLDMADLDGDGDLDLLLARQLAGASDGRSNLLVLRNDGIGRLEAPEPGEQDPEDTHLEFALAKTTALLEDVEVTDLDANGAPDLIAVDTNGSAPLVYLGRSTGGVRRFWNATQAAALGSGSTFGVMTTDFNGDSDPDVFLLRPEIGSDKSFLYRNPRLSAVPPSGSAKFLTIAFNSLAGGINRLGLGSKVSVTVTSSMGELMKSSQVVDGGSGRGSQGSGKLVFGLAGASTAAIKVTWPNGLTQNYPNASALAGFPNVTLGYVQNPQIDAQTIHSTYTPSSGDTVHEFTWWTQYAGGAPEVLLVIANPATALCKSMLGGGTQKLLKAGVAGVSVVSVPMNGGVEHRVYYTASCWAVCNYNFTVRNNVGGTIFAVAGNVHHVTICGGFGE